ncbi:MAG: hypothetical protein LBI13_01275 [Streptococcaceae bacterium]|jgi:hypothetical protein|nr:hypothetical protein [Streptococcaceae bacterium]
MKDKRLSWENPNQNYKLTLVKRRSERRYRTLQLAKTLRVQLMAFKRLGVATFNSEILLKISELEGNADYQDDAEFSDAKKFVNRMKRELTKLEK